jgi:hypothetical protein
MDSTPARFSTVDAGLLKDSGPTAYESLAFPCWLAPLALVMEMGRHVVILVS